MKYYTQQEVIKPFDRPVIVQWPIYRIGGQFECLAVCDSEEKALRVCAAINDAEAKRSEGVVSDSLTAINEKARGVSPDVSQSSEHAPAGTQGV